jgi:hypothetical protein
MNEIFSTTDTAEATAFERSLPPGDYEIWVKLAAPMEITVDELRDYLARSGVELYSVNLKGDILQIRYHRPGIVYVGQWEAVIPLILPVVIIGAVVFGIFKLGDISQALIPLILVTGGVLIVIIAAAGREAVTAVATRL